jgi:hypothetical protein
MAVEEPVPGGAVKLFNRWTFEDVQVPTSPPPPSSVLLHSQI